VCTLAIVPSVESERWNSLDCPLKVRVQLHSELFLEVADQANEENGCRRFCAEDPLPKDGSCVSSDIAAALAT
jgi:hypothetical protein